MCNFWKYDTLTTATSVLVYVCTHIFKIWCLWENIRFQISEIECISEYDYSKNFMQFHWFNIVSTKKQTKRKHSSCSAEVQKRTIRTLCRYVFETNTLHRGTRVRIDIGPDHRGAHIEAIYSYAILANRNACMLLTQQVSVSIEISQNEKAQIYVITVRKCV